MNPFSNEEDTGTSGPIDLLDGLTDLMNSLDTFSQNHCRCMLGIHEALHGIADELKNINKHLAAGVHSEKP